MKKKLIACITGSRADYSRGKSVFRAISEREDLELQLIVTGTHLLYRYGYTVEDIEKDGFNIYQKCYISLEGETPVAMAKSTGLAVTEFSTILDSMKPDVLLIIGDRFEAMASTLAGALLNIPIAHIQGGELTGSIDENLRHAITKLSNIHFPSSDRSRDYLIRMGEESERVINVGCPTVSDLLETRRIPREELLKSDMLRRDSDHHFDHAKPYVLCFYHPVTQEWDSAYEDTIKLMQALKQLKVQTVFLYPNIDAGSEDIVKGIRHFLMKDKCEHIEFYKHFPFEIFISLLAGADCIVGNSSAGIRESMYFGTPVVNIGNRQRNRECGANVIHTGNDTEEIIEAVNKQLKHGPYEKEFIYGSGKSAERIAKLLAETDLSNVVKNINYLNEEQN